MKNIIKKIFDKSSPPILIAEISANHNGLIKNAKKLIMTAKKNGADIVKLQTYEPRNMTINSSLKDFLVKDGLWKYWYSDGRKESEEIYTKGIRDGVCSYWDYRGLLTNKIRYKDGKENGRWIEWYFTNPK